MKDFNVLSQEQTIVNIDESFQGTYDLLAEKNGEKWLIDFKSNKYKKEYAVQLSGYDILLENSGIQVDRFGVFLFSTGELIEVPKRTILNGRIVFNALLEIEKVKRKVRL